MNANENNGVPAPSAPTDLGVRAQQRLLAQRIYELVRALGPDCTLLQAKNHMAEEGIEVTEDQWRYARRKAFPERFPTRAQPAAPPKPRPVPTPAAPAKPSPDPVSTPTLPAAPRAVQEIVAQLRAARRLLRAAGTLAEARLMLDAAAELAQEESP